MMNFDFTGKAALVTGGASGIGLATARDLVAYGAQVMVADFNDYGADLADEIGAKFIKTDVASEADIQASVNKTIDTFGRLDFVVACAGIRGQQQNIAEITEENWTRVNDIDYNGVFLTNKYAIMAMREQGQGGSIVNLSSLFGLIGLSTNIAYSAAKGGLINMTRAAGTHYFNEGIRVNAVCPGVIETSHISLFDKASYYMLQPEHQVGTVNDVVNAIVFLLSDNARFISGTSLSVDGGYTAL